jgi:elongation factor P
MPYFEAALLMVWRYRESLGQGMVAVVRPPLISPVGFPHENALILFFKDDTVMKVSANDLRVGNVIDYKNKLWAITRTMHTQPGKGGAYIQAEMKALMDGQKLNERFRSSETIERAILEEVNFQYLYSEGDRLNVMNQETFEQLELPDTMLSDEQRPFLQENMIVAIKFHDGKPLFAALPETVVMQIVEADPVVKGQTATSSYKPAVLENGVRIMVPPFIESGIRVVVNTLDGTYVERAKD